MTPQKATLDSFAYTFVIQSYRRLAPMFQHSLSAVSLGLYLCVRTKGIQYCMCRSSSEDCELCTLFQKISKFSVRLFIEGNWECLLKFVIPFFMIERRFHLIFISIYKRNYVGT
jgi:hypothetical protein